ncbi:ABC transporter ATP-binding protein [Mesorhizobium xinjiangense]|uniref:ABC transporter ATP-binding protein n=1 Tax=Mesorhizobium xinjiangense TaxID=2678685 RepID=UPI0012ECBD91|nr:sn-glycerol-3-phosphate ABC transporter ATP-binding protein UgpC [Mesorhizobium xinjiangense]
MATLQLEKITKSFGPIEVIKAVDLEVTNGEFIVFVGPSGCGKSTLLRMIAGLEEATSGTIRIDGEICNDKPPKERGIAMVFQSYALYPHKTAYQNMAFSLKLSRRPKAEIDARIRDAARILEMEHLLDRRPHQLSGGQRQRVAIGRAIVRHPKVFLFDEPLSNLDAALRVSMRREIARLHTDLQATMIYVTHDQVEAMTLADRIVVLEGGAVRQVGTPMELYHHPANLFVAGFIGSPRMNFVEGRIAHIRKGGVTVSTIDFDTVDVPLADTCCTRQGAAVTLGLRPEGFIVSATSDVGTAASVRLVEQLGDETLIEAMTAGGQSLVVKAAPSLNVAVGEPINLNMNPAELHLFDEAGQALPRASAKTG